MLVKYIAQIFDNENNEVADGDGVRGPREGGVQGVQRRADK